MFSQLLQLTVIIYCVAEARLPLPIQCKSAKRYYVKDCQRFEKNETKIVTFKNCKYPKKIDAATEGEEL